ncbi:MAG: hypothetical protein EP315_07090 [Gammaproteobacteria bacterium]|nr:MAG: hypothetical protein EP315_07090 [Gammaproteobacteria bacterium]
MKFQGVVPVISCQHIEQTLRFYEQAFRYVVINKNVTTEGLQWVHLKSDNSFLMLQRQATENPAQITKNDKILLYYYTDDVEDQFRFMQARGIDPDTIATTEYGMKEYYLTDPEGNRLCIGQKME